MSSEVIKGNKIDITKRNPDLKTISVGLGWIAGTGMKLNASAFLLGVNGKVTKDEDLIFCGNTKSEGNSVVHINGGERDKQTIKVNLTTISSSTEKIAFAIAIYQAQIRNQNFGQVSDIYIRIADEIKRSEICCFNIEGMLSIENALVLGELYRYKGEWKFNAVGSGFDGGMTALCNNFGIEVSNIPNIVTVSAPTPKKTLLNKLKKGNNQVKKHSLVDQDLMFRYAYGFGVAFLVCADNVLEDEEALKDLLRSLELPTQYFNKILQSAEEPQEDMIQGLIESLLEEKSHKYIFLADVYLMSTSHSTVSVEEEDVISSFAELLGVSESECLLVKELVSTSASRDINRIAKRISELI